MSLHAVLPLLLLSCFLSACFKLQQLRLSCSHLVVEDAVLDLHVSQQLLQLLHPLTSLCRLLLGLLQPLCLLSQLCLILV